jgi:hypothetical protein
LAAARIAATQVRGGGDFPGSIVDKVQGLPGVKVDPSSFQKVGYDVIFSISIEDTSGNEQKIWVRCGTKTPKERSAADPVDVALSELGRAELETSSGGGGGKEPPNDKRATETHDSGDGKSDRERKSDGSHETKGEKAGKSAESVGVLVTREVQAMFYHSADEAKTSPMISS